jgi:hypothetical protein
MTRFLVLCAALWVVATVFSSSAAQTDPHRPAPSPQAAQLFATSDDCVA